MEVIQTPAQRLRLEPTCAVGEGRLITKPCARSIPSSQPPEPTQRQKNFLPLVSEDGERLFFVVKVFPFKICEMDVQSGECAVVDLASEHPLEYERLERARRLLGPAAQWANFRGSAGFVSTRYGYLGMVRCVLLR